jgi:peroxiredoxin
MAPEVRGKKFVSPIASLARAATFALVAGISFGAGAAEFTALPGGPQPTFTLLAIDGAQVALGAQHGDAVLVHFFATWCEPCREELPALTRLSERGGVTVLAISVDEPDTRVQRFVQTTPVKFPVLLDRDRAIAKAWKVSTLPTTFVLDSKLQPRLVVETDYAWDAVDSKTLIDSMSAAGGPNRQQQSLREDNDNALR